MLQWYKGNTPNAQWGNSGSDEDNAIKRVYRILRERGAGFYPGISLGYDSSVWCSYGAGAVFFTPVAFADSDGNPVTATAPTTDAGGGQPAPIAAAKPDGSAVANPAGPVLADKGDNRAPAPAPDAGQGAPTTSVVTNPDGTTVTTTTTGTAPGGTVTVTEETRTPDGTQTTKTTRTTSDTTTTTEETKHPDGTTSSRTETTSTTTDADGNVTLVNTSSSTDGKTGVTTRSSLVKTDDKTDKNLYRKSVISLTDKDGNTTTTTMESTPTKFFYSTTTTDKDGKIISSETSTHEGNTITGSGFNGKGKYKVTEKDGGVYVEWDLPSGSGEGNWYPPGTEIKLNDDKDDPKPFKAILPPPKPAPTPSAETPPEQANPTTAVQELNATAVYASIPDNVFVKARQQVLEGGTTGEPVGGQVVKLLPSEKPDLPGYGQTRPTEDTGFDKPPAQCATGPDGGCTIQVAIDDRPYYRLPDVSRGPSRSYRVDVGVPKTSGVVIETTGKPEYPVKVSDIPLGVDIVSDEIRIGDRVFERVGFDVPADATFSPSQTVDRPGAHYESDYCRDKQPGPPLGTEPRSMSALNQEIPGSAIRLGAARGVGRRTAR